jgi:TRAP-type C4-dicarboxylate transport system permease small subunit
MHEEVKQATGYVNVLWQISRALAAVGAVLFGVMMMVTVIDVCGRYFFTMPLNGAAELVGIMLIIGGTWGMGYCQLERMHIRIGLFAEKLPKIAQRLLWVITF